MKMGGLSAKPKEKNLKPTDLELVATAKIQGLNHHILDFTDSELVFNPALCKYP